MPGATPILAANSRTAASVFGMASSRTAADGTSTSRENRAASASLGSSAGRELSSIHTWVF